MLLNELIDRRFEVISYEIKIVQGKLGKIKQKENPALYEGYTLRNEMLDKTRTMLSECKGKTEAETLRNLNGIVKEFYWTYTTPYKRDQLNHKDANLMENITQECLNIIECLA